MFISNWVSISVEYTWHERLGGLNNGHLSIFHWLREVSSCEDGAEIGSALWVSGRQRSHVSPSYLMSEKVARSNSTGWLTRRSIALVDAHLPVHELHALISAVRDEI
ncbi:hypothetical protein L484_001670 [Morus notabilis]|uniref:Uncharacterized protein n=1 Tax=Morus notabilis TaxID=981085 RepID=W9RRF2_9ROSA|nr:hypothetical protein L484_001670 [Morus notabilis]